MQNNSTEYQHLRETLLPDLLRQLSCDQDLGERAFFRGFRTTLQQKQPAEEGFAANLTQAFGHYVQLFQQDTELAWKEQLRRSDAAAWEQVYRSCYQPVAAMLAHKFQSGAEEARDVFQETVVVLLKYLNKPGAHIFATVRQFLVSTARRIKLNMLKGLPRQHQLEEHLVEEQLLEPPVALPTLLQPDDRLSQVIQANLKKLSPAEQEIIRLKHEGRSMDQIADHFDITGIQEQRRNTARQRLHRAMTKLEDNIRNSLRPGDPLLRFLDKKSDDDKTPQA